MSIYGSSNGWTTGTPSPGRGSSYGGYDQNGYGLSYLGTPLRHNSGGYGGYDTQGYGGGVQSYGNAGGSGYDPYRMPGGAGADMGGVDGPIPTEQNTTGGNAGNISNSMDPHDYWNYVPEAGYAELMRQAGLQGADPYSRYAQAQYQRYYNMYQGDAARDPNMGFYDWYLRGQATPNGPPGQIAPGATVHPRFDPRSEFMNLAPSQRGDSTSSLLTPRARWSMG